jgi:hypothetical protein
MKRPPPRSEKRYYPEDYRYGVIEDTRLYDGVVLLDCNLSCTSKAFGELAIHLQHLGRDLNGPTRGMLFSKSEFWLYEQQNNVPLVRMVGKWTEDGAFDTIRSFFDATLERFRRIDELCVALYVRPMDPKLVDTCESGFLGQGGFGRVIKVVPIEREAIPTDVLALKFVRDNKDTVNGLRFEHRRMQLLAACSCSLITTPMSECLITSQFSDFLMKPVERSTCTREMVLYVKKPSIDRVLFALYKLHIHEPNPIIPGNPRLPNLIETEDGLTWIGLWFNWMQGDGPRILETDFINDMTILVESLFPSWSQSDDHCRNLIESYGRNRNDESITALIQHLKVLLQK